VDFGLPATAGELLAGWDCISIAVLSERKNIDQIQAQIQAPSPK
jgi:hypothetical protein